MSAHPTPHIGPTLAQRHAQQYEAMQRAIELERSQRLHAALQAAAELDRIRMSARAKRRSVGDWIGEQMQIPEAHEGAWLAVFFGVALLAGLGALWGAK